MSVDESLRELGFHLHEQLLAGNPTATARIAEEFWEYTKQRLTRSFPTLSDPHLIDTAVGDALISYFRRPAQFDPDRLSLPAYLYMSARGDLLNAIEQATRRERKQVSLAEDVEVEADEAEKGVEVPDPYDLEEEMLVNLSPVWRRLGELFPDPVDRELVVLILEGERGTNEFAAVLGIQGQDIEEQARVVKRHKDRLKKTIQRHRTDILSDE